MPRRGAGAAAIRRGSVYRCATGPGVLQLAMAPALALLMAAAAAAGSAATTTAPAIICSIASQPGARGDNHTLNTAQFRAAAECCAGKGSAAQRAVLLVPAGVWLSGAFNLSSHTELRLAAGARIAAVHSLSREQYPAVAPFPS
eukprot:COSAG06_NODE_11909_length_1448_cov_12.114900_2_plen_144_part_00